MSNKEMAIQNQEQNQNAEEEPNRLINDVFDSDGHVIDLNSPPPYQ